MFKVIVLAAILAFAAAFPSPGPAPRPAPGPAPGPEPRPVPKADPLVYTTGYVAPAAYVASPYVGSYVYPGYSAYSHSGLVYV